MPNYYYESCRAKFVTVVLPIDGKSLQLTARVPSSNRFVNNLFNGNFIHSPERFEGDTDPYEGMYT